jgi:IS5 family transposase
MKPKKQAIPQEELFRSRLVQIIDLTHPLCQLAAAINWSYFEEEFGALYIENVGRPGKPIRLMVALHYLKHTYDESDESVVERFLENPYWQYFAGFEYFQHELPVDPTSLVKWRKRIGSKGMEQVFYETLKTAQRLGLLKRSHLNKVNVDTTVQEKAIAFPTDSRLYHKMRERLVKEARVRGIPLRQSYVRLSKKALARQSRYSHAKQFKRARKETRKLRTYLGRVTRDIRRKADVIDVGLEDLLQLSERLLAQERTDKHKLYSIHEPQVECISKGKAHKRYEFGCKVSVVTTSRNNWVIGIRAHHGNPYDGHTLGLVLDQIERGTGWQPKEAYCDQGYRGHGYNGPTKVHIVGVSRGRRRRSRSERKWRRRRSAVEPKIGHLKYDNRLDRNYLKGMEGDRINALLAGSGANLRKLLGAFLLPLFNLIKFVKKLVQYRLSMIHKPKQGRVLAI